MKEQIRGAKKKGYFEKGHGTIVDFFDDKYHKVGSIKEYVTRTKYKILDSKLHTIGMASYSGSYLELTDSRNSKVAKFNKNVDILDKEVIAAIFDNFY